MDWLKTLWNALKDNPEKVIALPFIGNLVIAMADGKITDAEFHALAKGATQFDLVLLVVAMVVLMVKKRG